VAGRHGFINYDMQDYSTMDAHWPHLAGEIGLVGLLACGWLFWLAGRASWRTSTRAASSPAQRVLAMTAAIFLLVAAIEAFASANLEDTFCGFMIFSTLGLTQGDALSGDVGQPSE
jgi:hypothetical protein